MKKHILLFLGFLTFLSFSIVCPASAQTKIYWAEYNSNAIGRSDLDGSDPEHLITSGLSGPQGLAVDVTAGKIYWAEYGSNIIGRANLDGSDPEDLITSGLSGPQGIALDVSAGKLYWAELGGNIIGRANLDGSDTEDLITSGLARPYHLALDVTGGKMYIPEFDGNIISRANLDGSDPEDLIISGLSGPISIELDLSAGKMYWVEYSGGIIGRANLDGSDPEDLIASGLNGPEGLALDLSAGKLYWTEYNSSRIGRANLDGSDSEHLIISGISGPEGIALGPGTPTLAEVVSFQATREGITVLLSWETASEVDNEGFHLWRAGEGDEEFLRITEGLIPSEGGAVGGATYERIDGDVTPGMTYRYRLEAVDIYGVSEYFGPVEVTTGALCGAFPVRRHGFVWMILLLAPFGFAYFLERRIRQDGMNETHSCPK